MDMLVCFPPWHPLPLSSLLPLPISFPFPASKSRPLVSPPALIPLPSLPPTSPPTLPVSPPADVAVMITAVSMALADAGVHLNDLVTASVVSICRGDLLLDPSSQEERVEEGRVVVALMPSLNEVVLCNVTGNMSVKRVNEAVELGIAGCMRLDEVLRATLRDEAAAALT
ncbi:unnamed protein product [Closterium sp. NIES-54]